MIYTHLHQRQYLKAKLAFSVDLPHQKAGIELISTVYLQKLRYERTCITRLRWRIQRLGIKPPVIHKRGYRVC